ncbi:L-asparaginase [Holothuria leucospilota]|uniref:asparaginase n=1 Tax=Holothuria leucospilota TaxID=206669 RepID=A0A9Q1CTL3_HOLLE|nr:L-asparaginase [Holothuria leucospilota]
MATKVLVLFTSGLLGMAKNKYGVYEPTSQNLLKAIKEITMTHDKKYPEENELDENYCALPRSSEEEKRIIYTVMQYNPLKDSSNITKEDWVKMVKDIRDNYNAFEGFVVLHGTDTMAYTASALSFMLEGLSKPVILTGSQSPISNVKGDGIHNLVQALYIAANENISEVALFFDKKLFRGNRVTNVSSTDLAAFDSPNFEPLLDIGVKQKEVFARKFSSLSLSGKGSSTRGYNKPTFHTSMNENVGLLHLYPGLKAETVREFLKPPMEGAVLLTFGAGNCSSDLLKEIGNACKKGSIVVNCTQCKRGFVSLSYSTGLNLSHEGVLSGADMTIEAAFTKLCFLLGNTSLSLQERKSMMTKNIRGEMTDAEPPDTF